MRLFTFAALAMSSFALAAPAFAGPPCPVSSYKEQAESVNMAISDNSTLLTPGITLTNGAGQTIVDVVVAINLAHTYAGDLTITLKRSGSMNASVKLLNTSACGANFVSGMQYFFRVGAATILTDNCNDVTPVSVAPGCYEPFESLGAFNGPSSDLWQLEIVDGGPGDEGVLNSWTLYTLCEPGPVSVDQSSWGRVKALYAK